MTTGFISPSEVRALEGRTPDVLDRIRAGERGYSVERARAAVPLGEKDGYKLFAEGAESATLYLYDSIGTDFWSGGGVTAARIVEDLRAIGEAEQLDVRVNSPGGDVFDGVAIHNALSRFPGRVVVHVDALAASIASLIAMAGNEIVIAENAMFMVHHPWTIAMGDGAVMRQTATVLDKTWSSMLTTYQRRTGRRAATIEKQITDAGGDWWMTAEEAVSMGFADRIEKPTKEVKACGLHLLRGRAAAGTGADSLRLVPEFVEVAAPRVERACEEDLDAELVAQERRRRIVTVLRHSCASLRAI